jgi:D-serine deaminase-like pyridoxal phosphate-dependent protein
MSIDSAEVADQLASLDIGILVEIDVGLGRVGIDPGPPAVELAKRVASTPGLRFEGIAFYPGQFKSTAAAEINALEKDVGASIASTLDGLKKAGLEARIVSGGSTPTWAFSDRVHGMNEIRPGTYIFNDRNTVIAGACAWEDCAASILTTVVSTARPGQMILDGGSKTFSSDRTSLPDVTYGVIVEDDAARFHKMNEEHGYVDMTACQRQFRTGDRVRVIPNHVCVAVNLHEQIYGVRQGAVEEVWNVEARGKLQ